MDGLRWVLLLLGRWSSSVSTSIAAGTEASPRSRRARRLRDESMPLDRTAGALDRPRRRDPTTPAEDDPSRLEIGKPNRKSSPCGWSAPTRCRLPGTNCAEPARHRHAARQIRHLPSLRRQRRRRVVFSAASLVEPGSFDLENIKAQKIPGISLFMVLPGPIDGAEAFDLMMAAART